MMQQNWPTLVRRLWWWPRPIESRPLTWSSQTIKVGTGAFARQKVYWYMCRWWCCWICTAEVVRMHVCYIYIVKVHAYYNHHGGTCALQLIVVACVLRQRLWIVTVHVHYKIKNLFVSFLFLFLCTVSYTESPQEELHSHTFTVTPTRLKRKSPKHQ